MLVFHAALFFITHNLPFLGDSIPSALYPAENIYNHGLATVWNYPDADPGHPTLYPFIIAVFWTLLGKSLWVSHLVSLFTGIALCIVLFHIARRFYTDNTAQFAVLMIIISPLYAAQLFSVSLQLPLTLLFFCCLYFLLERRYKIYTLFLCLMMLAHLQGAFMLLFLAALDFWQQWKETKSIFSFIKNRLLVYALPFAALCFWAFLHYKEFGWALSSPNYLRGAPTLKGMLYNVAIAGWRVLDFGYIAPIAVVVWFIIKQKTLAKRPVSLLGIYLLHLLIIGGGISLLFAYPPIHRYFLSASLILLLLYSGILELIDDTPRKIVAITTAVFLIGGNFMYYPGKCMGDGNLAYLPIHQLQEDMKKDIPNEESYTYAPLSYPSSIRYLDENKGLKLRELYNVNLDTVRYVLQCNMNCEFSAEELEKLSTWHGNSYESGAMYINIYANPAYIKKPEGWKLRQPSGFEKFIIDLKR